MLMGVDRLCGQRVLDYSAVLAVSTHIVAAFVKIVLAARSGRLAWARLLVFLLQFIDPLEDMVLVVDRRALLAMH
jgi:hypothetical protein